MAQPNENVVSIRSANVMAEKLIEKIKNDPKLAEDLATRPEQVLPGLATEATASADAQENRRLRNVNIDGKIYTIVVWALSASVAGVIVAIALIACIQLFILGRDVEPAKFVFTVPDGLIALGSAAIGALAGLLMPLSGRH